MPITIRKIELFCSLLFFSPTSLQRAKNACFSLIFSENSAFRSGFELRRSDVKKDFFFNIFRRRLVESSSDNFRFFPINTVNCDIYQKTRNQFDSNVTWVRIPPSAPKAAPCGVLLIILRQAMQGLQGGIRTARRGGIRASAPSITTQFHIG